MTVRVLQSDHVDEEVDGVHVAMRLGARHEQQDGAFVAPGVAAVADGMGGHHDGAAAAMAALEAFSSAIHEGADLQEATVQADAAVRALTGGQWRPRAPGTTLVAAQREEAGVAGVWSGDSRAYRLRADGHLEGLTEDHGTLGGIEHALGSAFPALHQDRFWCPAEDTLGLLLCSDGLTGAFEAGPALVEVEEPGGSDAATGAIARLLTTRGLSELVEVAAETGTDNVTAVWWPLRGRAPVPEVRV